MIHQPLRPRCSKPSSGPNLRATLRAPSQKFSLNAIFNGVIAVTVAATARYDVRAPPGFFVPPRHSQGYHGAVLDCQITDQKAARCASLPPRTTEVMSDVSPEARTPRGLAANDTQNATLCGVRPAIRFARRLLVHLLQLEHIGTRCQSASKTGLFRQASASQATRARVCPRNCRTTHDV